MNNTNWLRTFVASFLLALLLRVGLGIPFLSSFIVIGVIFLISILRAEIGTGVTTLWKWILSAKNVLIGIAIFVSIRFFAAKVLGLYPVDTYAEMNAGGGLYGILPGHDIATSIVWELAFAGVAISLTAMWVNGTNRLPVRAVFVLTLILATAQIAWRDYVDSWPDRTEVSNKLKSNGVVGTLASGGWALLFGQSETEPPPQPTSTPSTPATRATAPAQEKTFVLEAECSATTTTSCFLEEKWDGARRREGRPLLVRFNGKGEWILLPRDEEIHLPASKFAPGKAEYLSADTENPAPVLVQVGHYEMR